jgi:AraC-like DNA-binding protein
MSIQWAWPSNGTIFRRRARSTGAARFIRVVSSLGAIAKTDYAPGNSGYYAIGDEPLPASRRANDRHQFATLEFSRKHLQKQFVENEADLEPQIRRVIFGDKDDAIVGPARPMSIEQRAVVANLANPPVSKAAQILWYQSKALELMAHFMFEPKDPEFFCQRQKRVTRERVERAKELLARDLANPLTLVALGQEVGCSPFYLSRMFSREVGLTIPQYLRKLRMERAAELLRTGRYNVTEAATEVGYSSLSHFSKAFCETIGCCPVLYPAAKNVILDR